jgi:serine/threonine protein kinase
LSFFLCRGSFSAVYKGILISNEEIKVAIKEINTKNLGRKQLADLQLEMNILSQLHHQSIVQLYAVYTLPSKKFLVMIFNYSFNLYIHSIG